MDQQVISLRRTLSPARRWSGAGYLASNRLDTQPQIGATLPTQTRVAPSASRGSLRESSCPPRLIR